VRTACLTFANVRYPTEQAAVKFRVFTQINVDTGFAFDQPRQDILHVGVRECIVHAQHLRRTLGTHAFAIPAFGVRVALRAEQDDLTVRPPWRQYKQRLRLREPGQVEKVAVLAKQILHITIAPCRHRSRNDCNRVR
jgi:hypothetical protein